jgi:hypothetical protein
MRSRSAPMCCRAAIACGAAQRRRWKCIGKRWLAVLNVVAGPQEEEELLKVEDTEKVPVCACPCVSLWLRAYLRSKEELVSRP